MKAAVEQVFDGSLQQVAIGGAYDATKINRGKHTGQFNLGPGEADKFIGPAPVGLGSFGETSVGIPTNVITAVKISNDLFWVFGSSAQTAASTRPVQLWTFVPSTNTYNFVGYIIATFPTATAHTTRGLQVLLENYTTGTVGVSGTTVTGSGTGWSTGLSVGSRIGFGSTDPNQITTWYEISAIGSDTSITLTSGAGTISAGTPYVIQDMMVLITTTNATATNGGLFVIKGLQYADFIPTGKTIAAATTVDKIKAVYWLKDAATITNTIANGVAAGSRDTWTQQYVYVPQGSSTILRIYRYNIRAPLTLTAGAATLTGSDMVITGTQTIPGTGSLLTALNGRIATLDHGVAKDVPSLFVVSQTRLMRIPLSAIVQDSTTYIFDSLGEVPPGNTNTNLGSGSTPFVSFDISSSINKVILVTSLSVYVTDYYPNGQTLDRRASFQSSQVPSNLRDLECPVFVHLVSSPSPSIWTEDGWLFWQYGVATTTTTNAFSAYPLAADLEFQSKVNNRIICPKITLSETPKKLYRVLVNCVENLGDYSMGIAPDMYKVQVRTSGIDDNSGAWIDLPQNGDLSGISTSSTIQFAFLFRTAGTMMLPARILSLAMLYETVEDLSPQYRWNFADYSTTNGTVAWVQRSLFGTTLPVHTINYYRSDNNQLVLTQSSGGTATGNFQYWNGSSWVNGLGTDSVGTRRRFVPSASLPSSVDLYAVVSVD